MGLPLLCAVHSRRTPRVSVLAIALAVFAGLLSAPRPAAAATIEFVGATPPFVDFASETSAHEVKVADLDEDGVRDIIALFGGSVRTALGDGFGGFAADETLFPTMSGGTLGDLDAGDVNGDAHVDIVTANNGGISTSNIVSVYLGAGDGTFAPEATFTAPLAGSVALAEMNDTDDDLDIVVATNSFDPQPHEVYVLLGAGDGTFAAPSIAANVEDRPDDLILADLNLDSDLDAVMTDETGLSIRYGAGNGTFGAFTHLPVGSDIDKPNGVVAADFNGDTRPDLVTVDRLNDDLVRFQTESNGTFTRLDVPIGPEDTHTLTVADFDLDGSRDLVIGDDADTTDNVRVLRGIGNGTFEPPTSFAVGDSPTSAAVAHLNADSQPDLVVGLQNPSFTNDQAVGVLLNATFDPPPARPPEPILLRLSFTTSSPKPKSQYGLLGLAQNGDPVNPIFGNYIDAVTDLSMAGPGLGVSVTRTYNSAAPKQTILGWGWNIAYDMELTEPSASEVAVRHADGRVSTFTVDGSNLVAAPGSVERLTKNPDLTYDLVDADHLTHHFDTEGRLATISDTNGNTLTLSYDLSDRWTGLVDAVGRQWTISYDASDRVSSITDPASRSVSYSYDTVGDLVGVTDVRGNTTSYTYDGDHQLLSAQDANGNLIIDNTYFDGRVIEQQDARGTHTFQYAEGETTYVDPEGGVWVTAFDPVTFELDSRTDPEGGTTSFLYDASGLVSQTTDPDGGVTSFTYDARHNIATVTDPSGETTTFVHDATDNLLQTTDALGRDTIYTYEPGSRNLLMQENDVGDTVTYTYEPNGLTDTLTDESGHLTDFDYNLLGQLTSVTDAEGGETTYAYDTAGRITTTSDPLSKVTTSTFDAAGNLLTRTDPEGGVVQMTYDDVGNVLTVTDPTSGVTTFTYDPANDLVSVEDPAGRVTQYERDDLGRPTTVVRPDAAETTYTYDGNGRVTQITTPLGLSTSMTYDGRGNALTVTDPLARTTSFAYDEMGRLAEVTDPIGNPTSFGYDAVGNRTSITDPSGNTTLVSHDALNRVTEVSDAADRTRSTTYTPTGRVASTTNGAGETVTYTYDDVNRLLSYTAGSITSSFTYDLAGRRAQMEDAQGVTTYTYDDAGRVLSVDGPSTADDVVQYAYDASGRRTQMSQPGSAGRLETSYSYLADGALGSVAAAGGEVTYAYDTNGRLSTASFSDDAVTTYAYDADSRLTQVRTVAGDTTLEDLRYTYDDAGRRTKEIARRSTNTFGYDALDRLTSHVRTTKRSKNSTTYTYDAAGNRTKQDEKIKKKGKRAKRKSTSYTYDEGNALLSIRGAAVTNDLAGRRTSGGGATYAYNELDQLESVTTGGVTKTFRYDGDGNRVGETVGTTSTDHLLDTAAPLPRRIAVGGAPFFYGHGLIGEGAGTAFRYDHVDALGSLRFQSIDGKASNVSSYAAFGGRVGGSGVMGFTGEPQSGGLVHLRARDLDTATGRFLTQDPAPGEPRLPQTLNMYPYVANNPANITDPTGMCWLGPLCGAWETAKNFVVGLFTPSPPAKKPPKRAASPAPAVPVAKATPSVPLRPAITTQKLTYEFQVDPITGKVSLIGQDGGSLIGLDGGSLTPAQLAALIGQDGGSLIGQDGGSLIGQDGGSLIGQDGGSLIGMDGGSLAQLAAVSVLSHNGGAVLSHNGGALVGNNGNAFRLVQP